MRFRNLLTSIRPGLMVVLAIFVLQVASAQTQPSSTDVSALAGTWKMESETPNGDGLSWTLTLSQKEGSWSGSVADPEGNSVPATGLTVSGNKIHFQTMYDGYPYKVDLLRQADTLTGTWSGDNGSGKTTGKRVK